VSHDDGKLDEEEEKENIEVQKKEVSTVKQNVGNKRISTRDASSGK
jgi:hypothetical protein